MMFEESPPQSNPWFKPLLLVTIVLILPVLLLIGYGESFQSLAQQWQDNPPASWVLAVAVIGILASDVFLPVPSGPVSMLAGSQLGIVLGTFVSTIGMTLGAVIAFALAKAWGRPLAQRYSSPEQLAELETACTEHGAWVLMLTRPLPILAEACALLVGALQMPWRQFLPIILVCNLVLSAAYAMLGKQASDSEMLPTALCMVMALPLLATWWVRRRLRRSKEMSHTEAQSHREKREES